MLPSAIRAWQEMASAFWQNPSSRYRSADRARKELESRREVLARRLDAPPEAIVFNSGATEGNNALFAWFAETASEGDIALSAIEHPCVREAARRYLPGRHHEIPVDRLGVTNLEALSDLWSSRPIKLVSIMAANNETGVIQPWEEALALCRQHGAWLHVDAAQHLGKLPARPLGQADFVTGCAHKFGGPKGVGFLKLASGCDGFKGQVGGEQELGHRGGTENLPGIAGMVAALEEREAALESDVKSWEEGRSAFEADVRTVLPAVRINGEEAPRIPNTSNLLLPFGQAARWALELDRHGHCVSTGSACASAKKGVSHVLRAMGLSVEEAGRCVRVSAGFDTTADDWAMLAAAFGEVAEELAAERRARR